MTEQRRVTPGRVRFKPTTGCKGTRRFQPGGKDNGCTDRACRKPQHGHWRYSCGTKGHRHWAFTVTEYEPGQKPRPYTSKTYPTKADARQALDQWRADFDTRPKREREEQACRAADDNRTPRFRDWVETWLVRKIADDEHRANTASQARPFLRRILDLEIEHEGERVKYGDLRLGDMTWHDTRAILEADAAHHGRPYLSYATKGLWSYLGGCLNRAAAEELARVNVASTLLVKPPTNAKIRRANPAKREDYGRWGVRHAQRFLAHAERDGTEYDERWSALWRLALDRGLRREELCGLRWGDVDTDTGKIRVRRVRVLDGNGHPIEHEAPKTEAGYRQVTVTEGTREALRLWRTAQDNQLLRLGLAPDNDGYVFTDPLDPFEPINPRRVSDTTKTAIQAARVPEATLHLFRHFAAVFALNAGESFKDVSVWMGHSDPGVTHRNYANYLTSEAAEAAARRRADLLGAPQLRAA